MKDSRIIGIAPRIKNVKLFEGCAIGMVRVGKRGKEEYAMIWCQKYWGGYQCIV